MEEKLSQIQKQFDEDLSSSEFALEKIQEIKIKYLGRKGLLNELFKDLALLAGEEKSAFGRKINDLKNKLAQVIEEKEKSLGLALEKDSIARRVSLFDFMLPSIKRNVAHAHPLTLVIDEICDLFVEMGFKVVEGPEIESEYYNFEALNIPPEHPSRDGFDTFYLANKYLLRSHTSPVQVRVMEEEKPPIRIVVPGKVYRPDATDASHSYMFHQIEGLFIDKGITLAHLKGVLNIFAKKLFGDKIKMRFRPHFFPFTEPSAEVDISCIICSGSGCRVCGQKGWLEILGAGMVHPAVLKYVNINSSVYSGLAFGMGIERICMLKYGIDDIRLFFENDLRFIRQFE